MSEKLSPNDIAIAAAQGVAIALNARKHKASAVKDELVYPIHHIICGIPQHMFEVSITQGADGIHSVGNAVQAKGP
ncbi:MAG: hypothetical protein WA777_17215 [Rhodanobacter sp.]